MSTSLDTADGLPKKSASGKTNTSEATHSSLTQRPSTPTAADIKSDAPSPNSELNASVQRSPDELQRMFAPGYPQLRLVSNAEGENLYSSGISLRGYETISLRKFFAIDPEGAQRFLADYYRAYSRSFPDTDEALSNESISKMLKKPGCSWDATVVRRGERIIAGYHSSLEHCGRRLFSLGDYLWVDKEHRKSGVGRMLYLETLAHRRAAGAVAHVGEINDPRLMGERERQIEKIAGITPEDRLLFWSKQGRQLVDCPWLQPPLRPGGREVEYLMLTIHPLRENQQSISRETLLDIWKNFYVSFDFDFDINQTLHRLANLTEQSAEFAIIPLTAKRSCLGGDIPFKQRVAGI